MALVYGSPCLTRGCVFDEVCVQSCGENVNTGMCEETEGGGE